MNTFTINGITYEAKSFSFNMVCDLEDRGISMDQIKEKPTTTARTYFAICAGLDDISAGDELEHHLISGGNFNELMTAMSKAMEESDFFRALKANAEKKTTKKKLEK